MALSGLGPPSRWSTRFARPLAALLLVVKSSVAQAPGAAETAPPASEPAPPSDVPTPPAEPAPPPPEAPAAPPPEEAPAATSEPLPASVEPSTPPAPSGPAPIVGGATPAAPAAAAVPWIRAHQALTLEGSLALLVRPESSNAFDEEGHLGADLGLSLYWDLKREFAAGLELQRASLGRGSASSGLDTVSIDYAVTSAMLGVRAYPKRSDLLDVYVGLQLGVGVQGVSAAGTRVAAQGPLVGATAYQCRGSDTPALQLGGGVGARLMLSPRWGVSARVNATGRRLTGELVEDCAQGLGTATTISAGLGLGYDFDLDP